MASESSIHKAAQAWCAPSTENIDMIPELAEVFAETLDEVQKQLKAQLELRDARIAQLEAENDALSRRLHHQYSGSSEPAAGNFFWRRYVNGGSSIWRLLFEVCDGGGRLWRAIVKVGRRRA